MQSELDSFFAHQDGECSGAGLLRHVTDRALAKARSKLHAPALWALNAQLIEGIQDQGLLSLWKGHRLVCADATVLAPAQRACHRTRHLAAPSQRALGLYLPGNEVMLHVAVGPESEGDECWAYLATTTADKVSTWELDGPAPMRVRLVRHVSSSGRVRVLATLTEDVATKVLADNLACLLNMSVNWVPKKTKRVSAAKSTGQRRPRPCLDACAHCCCRCKPSPRSSMTGLP